MADTRTRLPLPEPVDYQIRLAGGRWTHCAKHIHEAAIKSGAAETRALYSADQMISFRAADNAALQAEVERLREDAERGRYMIANGGWYRSDEQTRLSVLVPHGSDLSCRAMREAAIDAARKAAP